MKEKLPIDISALLAAAMEIDRKMTLQESRTKRLCELASQARRVAQDSEEHRQIKNEARELSITVVDFGDAINDLRVALRRLKRQ